MTKECPKCGNQYEEEQSLRVHWGLKHDEIPPWEKDGLHNCPTCGKGFDSSTGMKNHHVKTHGESIAGVELECANCGTEFRRNPARVPEGNAFCSYDCQGEFKVERVSRECENCGKELAVIPSRDEKESVYCDISCLRDHESESWQVADCEWCGEEFEYQKSVRNGRFCSKECQLNSKSENWVSSGKDHPRYNKVECECHHCGDSFKRAKSQIENYEWVFCSLKCRSSWQRESDFMAGENNHFWKGGSGDHFYGPDWPKQRRKARERDDYTCQSCGVHEDEYGRELSVHHIKPFRSFVNDYGEADFEAANDLQNLVSLCKRCHRDWEGVPVRPELAD